jgi:outer membrane protein
MRILIALFVAIPVAGEAQEALSLSQAVMRALEKNGSVEAGAAAVRAADARITQARGSYLPKVSYTESWTRSNNQVYVFGSLLAQKQFSASNFDIGFLNSPPFLNNFQSQVVVDQALFDFGGRRSRVRSAELGRNMASEDQRRTEMNVIADVVRAYTAVVLGKENLDVAHEAVKSAEADLKRAETRRAAGVITDADVLALRVHMASMREREIQAQTELETAKAALNQVLGQPLDAVFTLTTPLAEPARAAQPDLAALERAAASHRPETREARLAMQLAETEASGARAALYPEFFARAGFETDRQRFIDRGGANWLFSAGFRWNLFNGFADRARITEAEESRRRAQAQARYADSAVQFETRRAVLESRAARKRIDVAGAAVEQARESLRIIRNRYESGLTDLTELLRAEIAFLEARTRYLAAVRDQKLASVAIELAAGTLTPNSPVIQE